MVTTASCNGMTIAYETFGSPADTPLLLTMGLATQMLGWHNDLVELLVAEGLFVVRYDNRDVGLSTHLVDAGRPELGAVLAGDHASVPYTLTDMADDTAALMTALGLDSAHHVGASMGGMIVQAVAIRHPARVRSLTSIMSTPSPRVAPPRPEALAVLLAPPARSRDEAIERAVATYAVIGSPGFVTDEDDLRARAATSYDRAYDPAGVARQYAAIQAGGDRTADLRHVRVPTLVVHGDDDPLVPVAGGRATAAAVPDAELLTVPGMGHDLPREVWPQLVQRISALVRRADAERAA